MRVFRVLRGGLRRFAFVPYDPAWLTDAHHGNLMNTPRLPACYVCQVTRRGRIPRRIRAQPRGAKRYTQGASRRRGCETQMATDYDSPRKTDDELTEDSLQELQARRLDKSSSTIDIDQTTLPSRWSCPVPTCPTRNFPSG